MTEPTPNLLGDRYRIERLIASGGMARVLLAQDTRLERPVAVKVIHSHLAADENFREKFLREAKIAAKLSHPNLVNVFDQGEVGNALFLVMEYVPGITLRDALNDFGKFTPKRALEVFEPFLQGLAAAHDSGILHRDIKPENVLLADDGRVKLSDFGLSRTIESHTQSGSLIGTVAYISPELATRGIADARSDVYSAGIMLFEMLTGKQPFEGDQAVQVVYQHANETVPKPSSLAPEVPEAYDRLVLWATARDANDRPKTAGELARAVTALRSGSRFDLPVTSRIDLANQTEVLSQPMKATQVISENHLAASAATQVIGNPTEQIAPVVTQNATDDLRSWQARRRWMIPLVTVLVIVVSSAAGWWFGAGPGGVMTVPEVTNRTIAQAESALNPLEATLKQVGVNSTSIAAGLVIRTEPAAASWFWRGGEIKLVISSGPKMAKLPALKGKNLLDATTTLSAAGFKLGRTTESFNDAALGTVFDYTASDGSLLALGSKVDLTISLGPLPALVGVGKDTAIATLEALGIKVSKTSEVFSDTVPAGSVVGITQPNGPLGKGGSVELQVSKGSNAVIMPNVVGETIAASIATLQNLGLKVIIDTNQMRKNWGIVLVKSSSVAAGATLRIGDSVTIRSR
jgi:serine/threonine-protein kinase